MAQLLLSNGAVPWCKVPLAVLWRKMPEGWERVGNGDQDETGFTAKDGRTWKTWRLAPGIFTYYHSVPGPVRQKHPGGAATAARNTSGLPQGRT